MFIRKYWVPISVVLLAICAVGFFILATQPPPDPIIIYKEVEVEKPTTQAPVVSERPPPPGASPNGHWHGDEWHDAPHEADETPAAPVVQSYIPEGAAVTPNFPPVDPNDDPVEAAYQRLEYIKNNPYAWGGVHSERATELIAKLMPPQKSRDHDHSDEIHDYLVELIAQGDPRAGEVIIANMCDGSVGGNMLTDALVEIGPPAVPYILPYLEKGVAEGGYIRRVVFTSLGRIGARYRVDLGSIVDDIIIPKFEVIAADGDAKFYETPAQRRANEAIAMLRR